MPVTRFTAAQLATLRAQYGTLRTMPPDYLPRFHALFDGCTLPALEQLAGAGIPFVSGLARNAVLRRKGLL